MKLKRFKATEVNGFLDFDLEFKDELTFVTGINGTGKTSALNFIIALIFPRLDYIAISTFKDISLIIEHEEETYTLEAKKSEEETILTCSKFSGQKVNIDNFIISDDMSPRHIREYEEEYNKRTLAKYRENPIVDFIENLPSPMYLGLERRSLSIDVDERHYTPPKSRRQRIQRNIFSRTIGQSLNEALYFARETFQQNRREEVHLDDRIRKRLVLGLLEFDPIKLAGQAAEPTPEELESIEEARRNMEKLPDLLNVDSEIISKRIAPLFKFFDRQRILFENQSSEEEEGQLISDRTVAQMEWSFNKTHLSKIDHLSRVVSEYNTKSMRISERTNEFLNTANSFLLDSGKTLNFNGLGHLYFTLHDDPKDEERDLRTLSSGEVQLIVILAHLYFNPEVGKANVFIIDEPELSLHLQWQEKFVDGVMAASDKTQFIMATHSPAIILDKTSNCIEIPVKHRK